MSSSPASSSAPALTASAVVAEAVSGSHVLNVQGYSLIKGSGVGKFIESGKFIIGGRSWRVRCYPDGWDSECAGWISVALFLLNPDATELKAKYRFSLLDQARDHNQIDPFYTEAVHPFSTKGRGSTNARFIRRGKFEKSSYLKGDCLELRCDVTFTRAIHLIENVATQFVAVPPSDMHRHFAGLLSTGDGVEVSFEVGGETFAAHRCVLAARSSVFAALLFGPMKEKTATCVKIGGMEPAVFKAMLQFIYTDSMPEMDEDETTVMAHHLLVAADMYNLPRLKLICEHELCKHIDRSTLTTTLALADQHGCRGLKEACLSMIKFTSNLMEIPAKRWL